MTEPPSLAREIGRLALRALLLGSIVTLALMATAPRFLLPSTPLEVGFEFASVAALGGAVEAIVARWPRSRQRDVVGLGALVWMTLLGIFPAQWQFAYLQGLLDTGTPAGALEAVSERVRHFPHFQPIDGLLAIFYAASVSAVGFARIRHWSLLPETAAAVIVGTLCAPRFCIGYVLQVPDPWGALVFLIFGALTLSLTARAADKITAATMKWGKSNHDAQAGETPAPL